MNQTKAHIRYYWNIQKASKKMTKKKERKKFCVELIDRIGLYGFGKIVKT